VTYNKVDRRSFIKLGAGIAGCLTGASLLAAQVKTGTQSGAINKPVDFKPSGDLWRLGAADLAQLIASKKVSSREVVQAHLERIDAVNDSVRAIPLVLKDEAIAAAENADRLLDQGVLSGPLHGVPITVKEVVDVAGTPTANGVAEFSDKIASRDAAEVSALKQAGAIPIARTNCPDFSIRWDTSSSRYGRTLNPWNPDVTAGGSSGGEAVALATGMSPLGIGTDLAGSLRYPAMCCGISSLKPGYGRISRSHESPGAIGKQLFGTAGPMARNVRDLRLALPLMAKQNLRDPRWTPVPLLAPPSQPVTVGLCADPGGMGVDPQVAFGVKTAGDALANAGYVVEEIDLPLVKEAASVWETIILTELREGLWDPMHKYGSAEAITAMELMLAQVGESDIKDYMGAFERRYKIAEQWKQLSRDYPLIVAPVSTLPPFKVGWDTSGEAAIRPMLDSFRLLLAVALLGLPAAVVPVGLAEGLPLGVQIIGDQYQELLCLDAAEVIESAVHFSTPIDPRTA
jgi:amidase